jgi:hypothetical protein
MNIVFDISQIDVNNMIFSDSKKNIIMDGNFIKIIYSNSIISTNGIYIRFPINIQTIEQISNKYIIKFAPHDFDNVNIIKSLSQLEKNILEYYNQFYNCNKTLLTSLNDQLSSGNIKIMNNSSTIPLCEQCNTKLFLKISGIWENETMIGITYKMIEEL